MYSKALNIICKSILVVPFLATSMTSISAELEEIVVTATKKAESLQDIAGSVQAITEDQLKKALAINNPRPATHSPELCILHDSHRLGKEHIVLAHVPSHIPCISS